MKTTTSKILSIFLAVVLFFSTVYATGVVSVSAASSPAFTVHNVSNISKTDAKISAKITNPAKTKISKVGFQLGTSKNNLGTNKYDSVSMTYSYVEASFLMSKYKVSLKAGTTYYYKFYITTGGKTYYSGVNNFKTKSASQSTAKPVFTVNNPSDITYNNAKISASITNPAKSKITQVGFQLGTTSKKYTIKKYDTVSMTNASINASYLMSKYGVTLKEKTKYYYVFYMITGGKTYTSGEKSFSTPEKKAYKAIKALNISRIYQPKNDGTGSCYLSSVATLIAYKKNTVRNAGKDYGHGCAVYKEVYKKNGNTTYVYDSTLSAYGLKKQTYSLSNLYNSLNAGKPAIIYSGRHASLVIAYKGNNTYSLKASDFIVMEISQIWKNSSTLFKNYANKGQSPYKWDGCYMTLSDWSAYTYNGSTNGTPNIMVTY